MTSPSSAVAEPPEIDVEQLVDALRQLIVMLDAEVGRRWMTTELRLKLEQVEILIGDRGTVLVQVA